MRKLYKYKFEMRDFFQNGRRLKVLDSLQPTEIDEYIFERDTGSHFKQLKFQLN